MTTNQDLAAVGAAVVKDKIAKDRLIEALEGEAVRFEKEALTYWPGDGRREIAKAKAAKCRTRIAQLNGGN